MSNPPSNTRRFIKAAWRLLAFQLVASIGAVGVTWYALQHVNGERGYGQMTPVPDATTEATDAAPATAVPATEAPPAETQPAIETPVFIDAPTPCTRESHYYAVQRGQWCDTRIPLRQEQRVTVVSANPAGPVPLVGYVGGSVARFTGQEFVSPAPGTLIVMLESDRPNWLVVLEPGP